MADERMPGARATLELDHVSARSGAGTGIRSLSFRVGAGRVHGILGGPRSGASEALAVIGGYLRPEAGRIELDGADLSLAVARREDAEALGIVVLRGEPAIVPGLSVAENVTLGNERPVAGLIRFGRMFERAAEELARVGLESVDVRARGSSLGRAERQVVGFARMLASGRKIVLMDEPFRDLEPSEADVVVRGIVGLAAAGLIVVVASARVEPLLRVADAGTVLAGGDASGTWVAPAPADALGDAGAGARAATPDAPEIAGATPADARQITGAASGEATRLVEAMVADVVVDRGEGRPFGTAGAGIAGREPALEILGWTAAHPLDPGRAVVRDASLTVGAGEIVGLAGLEGSGAGELLLGLFEKTAGSRVQGAVRLAGVPLAARNPTESIAAGLVLATERTTTYDLGLIGGVPSRISPGMLGRLARLGVIDRDRSYPEAAPVAGLGGIAALFAGRGRGGGGAAAAPSGSATGEPAGTSIRNALAGWLAEGGTRPTAVLLDHPTAGATDALAHEIHGLIRRLADAGTGILIASDDLGEILGTADRAYAMQDGRITAELPVSGPVTTSPAELLAPMVLANRR